MDPDEAARQYLSSLKTFGRFVTNNNGSGVNLLDSDGYIVKVSDPDTNVSRPLSLTWAELKALSSEEAERLTQQGRTGFISPEFRAPKKK
jgi:hypothetical protein